MEEKTRIKKILVVSLDNLGDAVMATSLLKPLKTLCPQAEIGLWVKTYTAGLFSDQSMIDCVHACDPFWDKSPGFEKGGFWKFLSVCAEVRRRHYDVAFILNTEWRRSLACALAGVAKRVGFHRRKSGFFLTHGVKAPKELQHIVDDHRKLLEAWAAVDINPQDFFPRLDLTQDERTWWDDWSHQMGLISRRYVVIHLFSGDEDKNWPLSCWVELIERLTGTHPDMRFVVVSGPGEEEKLTPFRSHLAQKNVIKLAAPSLKSLKAVLSQARLLIGGDSGLGHVAAALGTPVLSLFGIGSPVRSRPLGRSGTAILEKSPLRQLVVPEVLSKVEELLAHV